MDVERRYVEHSLNSPRIERVRAAPQQVTAARLRPEHRPAAPVGHAGRERRADGRTGVVGDRGQIRRSDALLNAHRTRGSSMTTTTPEHLEQLAERRWVTPTTMPTQPGRRCLHKC